MFIVYLIITAMILAFTTWNIITEKDWKVQAGDAMVLIPLLLRIFLVK
ncbi:MAG: hypothetical protein LBK05_00070 [Treponema sp.]|jgi:hypothetical protein|nr:hypothetical protein [Treponema sp.]